MSPHFFNRLREVSDLGVWVQSEYFRSVDQRKLLDKLQIIVPISFRRYHVVDEVVLIKVERLELVEQKITEVLVHISVGDATIVAVYHSSTVHHLVVIEHK